MKKSKHTTRRSLRKRREVSMHPLRNLALVETRTNSRTYLQQYLVHVRDLPNGYDFIFKGVSQKFHSTLHEFISLESKLSRTINFAHAQVEDSFILRLTGPPEMKSKIKKYFESSS